MEKSRLSMNSVQTLSINQRPTQNEACCGVSDNDDLDQEYRNNPLLAQAKRPVS